MGGRSIFITGGGSGIGRAVAQYFAARGWFVGLYDVDETKLRETQTLIAADRQCSGLLDVRVFGLSVVMPTPFIKERLATLTPREAEVMRLVTSGKANKVVGADLGVSQRTVEIHRAHVMEKMRAGSLAELVRMVLDSEESTHIP